MLYLQQNMYKIHVLFMAIFPIQRLSHKVNFRFLKSIFVNTAKLAVFIFYVPLAQFGRAAGS